MIIIVPLKNCGKDDSYLLLILISQIEGKKYKDAANLNRVFQYSSKNHCLFIECAQEMLSCTVELCRKCIRV